MGRVDLKADWTVKKLKVLSVLFEEGKVIGKTNSRDREAVRTALDRYAAALKLKIKLKNYKANRRKEPL